MKTLNAQRSTSNAEVARLARLALPLMSGDARAEAMQLIADLEDAPCGGNAERGPQGGNAERSTFNSQRRSEEGNPSARSKAAAAFERDMRPVREAIVSALEAGDLEALRGLRALLPHLLAEVNRSPELADVLAFHLGKSLVEGLVEGKAESGRRKEETA